MYSPQKVKAVTVISLITVLTGMLVLTGWIFQITVLQTIGVNNAVMKFNTALCLVLAGLALLLTQFPVKKYNTVLFVLLSSVVLFTGLISISEDLFHFNSGIDQFFVNDVISADKLSHPGRISVNTAACFILLGAGFLGFSTKNSFIYSLSQFSLNLVTIVSGIAIIGYLYGLVLFYSFYSLGAMAVHSAVLFFLLSGSASLLHPSIGITGLFTGKLVGNTMARRLFVLILLVVVIFGAFRAVSLHRKLFSLQTGVSLLVICFICVGLGLMWYTVNWLNKIDARRHAAEKEVRQMNDNLEKIVKERSKKLLLLVAKFRESESKFRTAFESSAIGMALISLKGKLLKVNKRLCEIVGYREQELLTMYFEDIAHPDEQGLNIDIIDKELKNEDEAYKAEKRYVCKNGAVVWISVNIAKVINKKGGPVYFVSQFEDITERKKAEDNLKKAYKQIQNQINSIKSIAWKQSHLIRSPVANLKGLATLLQEEPENDETLKFIHMELERLDRVIIEMAEDASSQGAVKITAKKRSFKRAG